MNFQIRNLQKLLVIQSTWFAFCGNFLLIIIWCQIIPNGIFIVRKPRYILLTSLPGKVNRLIPWQIQNFRKTKALKTSNNKIPLQKIFLILSFAWTITV